MKYTAIIILNYNNAQDTRNCIESILKYNTAPVKLIVVDNGSQPKQYDALVGIVNEFSKGDYRLMSPADIDALGEGEIGTMTLIETGDNLGYAQGNNVGVRLADLDPTIDNLLILNNDILFVDDIIPGLIECQRRLPNVGIVSPVLYKRDMQGLDLDCARTNERVSEIIASNFLTYVRVLMHKSNFDINSHRYILKNTDQTTGEIPIELPSGSCMLVSKALFDRIGMFDPNTFLYYEENILYSKIQALGLTNYLSLDLKCIHLGAATMIKHKGNPALTKKKLQSRRYYVEHYSGANIMTLTAYRISEAFFKMTVKLRSMFA